MAVRLQAAHQHPSSHSHGATRHSDVTEMEYKAWHDLPQDPSLAALIGKGASATSRLVGGREKLPAARVPAGGRKL